MAEVSSALVRPKILVWGGDEPATKAVGIFDPISETWSNFPTAKAFRSAAASAVINERLYVCGGYSGNPEAPSTSLGIWQTLPTMSQGCYVHAVAGVGARLCVCGGMSDGCLTSAECFNTLTNTWTSLPAMCRPRGEAGVAVIKNHVYIVGGDDSDTSSERLPPTGNWEELPDMNEARTGCAIAVVADRLYVCGGYGSASVERFDPDVGVWESMQPMFEERFGSAVVVLRGQLYICGGEDGDDVSLSSTERFDPTHNTWERLAPMTYARSEASVVLFDGRLFINGGAEEDDGNDDDNEVEDYDDGSDEGHGGEHGIDGPLGCAECFDPVTGRWERCPDTRFRWNHPHVVVISC